MSNWQSYNANPLNNRVGDCTVRAISKVLEQDWHETYLGLCLQGFEMADMPSANHVWGSYLRKKGFERQPILNSCSDCYTDDDFCNEHKNGKYVLALNSHVVAVIDGIFFDTWNSGNEVVLYYWLRED